MKSLLRVLALSMIFSTAYVSRGAAAITYCPGTCTVHCGLEGTYYYYDISPRECCLKTSKFPVCSNPDAWAEWYPGYSWECWDAEAFICP